MARWVLVALNNPGIKRKLSCGQEGISAKDSDIQHPSNYNYNYTIILINIMYVNNKNVHILIGEGNGTPLQYSCLENPIEGGAW